MGVSTIWPSFKTLHPSWLRRVLPQGEVGAGPVVVDAVGAQQATQMGLVQHDDVVEALAAQGPDEALHVRILPRRPRRRLDFMDFQGLDAAREHDPVDRIAVPQKVSGRRVPRERLDDLLGRPLGCRAVGHVDVDDVSPVVRQDHEDEQHRERQSWAR
jgi:hypothetical protein